MALFLCAREEAVAMSTLTYIRIAAELVGLVFWALSTLGWTG